MLGRLLNGRPGVRADDVAGKLIHLRHRKDSELYRLHLLAVAMEVAGALGLRLLLVLARITLRGLAPLVSALI